MAPTERLSPATLPPYHRPCPVCGADCPGHLYRNTMAPLDGRDLSYDVARCGQCGFHYASDLPSPATYATYYRELSKYDQPGNGSIPLPLRERASQAVALCRLHLADNACIIDIGCGAGALLHAFREAGFRRLHGIDPAPGGAQALLGYDGGEKIIAGNLRDAHRLPLADADLVCLTGITEHLPELHEDMAWLCSQLSAGARILIEVPSADHFPNGEMPYEPFGELSLEHLQYFDANALAHLMANFGFRPLTLPVPTLDDGCAGSLFGLFTRGSGATHPTAAATGRRMENYLTVSERDMRRVIDGIIAHGGPFVIHGAGSHTARLLPRLATAGLADRIAGLVDNNRNLQGRTLGAYPILTTAALATLPTTTVLISSFAAQEAIAASLPSAMSLLLLYDKK